MTMRYFAGARGAPLIRRALTAGFMMLMGTLALATAAAAGEGVGGEGSLERLSTMLFTDYLFPFEVTSVILLVALVGAIVLARSEDD
mgnify:CR=1 FL=1